MGMNQIGLCDPKSNPVEWLKHISKPLDFDKIHIESLQIAQKTPKAGRWFLNSAEFKDDWRDGTLRKLWCHGIPCIYVYFNHRQHQDHCLTRLLCTLILQLLHGTKHVSTKIQEAHSAWKSNQQMPCERDYLKMLKSQAKSFKRIFFVVDALDECLDDTEANTLNSFLEACQELPDNFRLLFTSRPVPKLSALIKPGCELPITANDDEINSYLRKFIESRPQLNGIVEKGCKTDPLFRDKTLETIVQKSQGMFLLAHLHIQSLASTHSLATHNLAEFRSSLAQLSTSPDAVYATALERIKKQDRPQRQLAMKALNWLVHAERQLSVDELAHALAIHTGVDESRSEPWQLPKASEIIGIEDALISACVGIVVVLPATDNKKTVRLIHATAEEYIKRNQAIGFPNEEAMSTSMLTRTCLDCLTRIPLSIGSPPESSVDDICQQYPLFRYAANFWGVHLDQTTSSKGDLYKLAWRFVSDKPKLDTAMHAMSDPRISHEANVSAVHIAAFFGLERLVRKAISNNKKVNFNAQTKRGETPLYWAVTHGRRSFAEFLIQEGAELNVPNVEKRTALHKAIMAGDRNLMEVILSSGSLNLELEDSEGYTCLRWAARYGQLKTVEALLKSGADVNAADKDSYTALRWAAHEGYKPIIKSLVHHGASVKTSGRDSWTLLNWAAQEGQDDMVKFLVKCRVDLDSTDADGFTALRWAMKYNRSTTAWLLIQARADVNKPDNQGTQPLHAAVQSCCGPDSSKASMNLLWLLLENKANVNAQAGKLGQTPLHLAAVGGSSSVVWLLLENGADPRRLDSKNRTALHCAITSKIVAVCRTLLQRDGDYLVHAVDQHGLTPLHTAALGGNSAIVSLLLENGADLRRVDSNRRTALHCAIQGEHAEVCKTLIQRGGNYLVLAVDDEKRSPLHHAASWGNLAIVGMLLDHQAPIDSQDSKGLTALHVAVSQGYEKVVELLLQRGAGMHIAIAKRKRTAMHIAATLGHLEIVETLLRHGAVVDARDSRGETPLHLADAHGHRMVKKLLVKRGADVQCLNRRDSTPWFLKAMPKEAGVTDTILPVVEDERVGLNGAPIQEEVKSWWKGDKRFAARVEDE
ncbi:Putative P-loop containing nucleoside triphosphate hydrolase [Colletotrichum destructivum]|uniref:P-loop containing nucleoside triphosphate hydrolase n=1 Tax=Colletotrichum destructivum TaxID=34406 RepID=A0AAX4IYH2_9PEZI|nr:Putative P-loop containing nucleoside triphosphate hydrolase [Colletotrichum destructivum]